MNTKIDAINSLIVFANKAFDGADTMRKAELVELLVASIKAVRALPDAPAPSIARTPGVSATPAITVAMCALAEYSMQMRDDKLNQLTYALMLKLNTNDLRECLDASVRRSGAGTATAEAP